MAYKLGQQVWTGGMKPKTTLLDRALNDIGSMASGLVPGIAEIGQTVLNDGVAALPFTKNDFRLDNLGGQMAKGFWEESALPPFLLGQFGEAGRRANARPVSALLDASLIAPAASMSLKGLTHIPAARPMAFEHLGFKRTDDDFAKQMFEKDGSPSEWAELGDLPATLPTVDGPQPMREFLPSAGSVKRFGEDELWMRRTRRTMTPGKPPVVEGDGAGTSMLTDLYRQKQNPWENDGRTEILSDDPWRHFTSYRAYNEPMAKIGDGVSSLVGKIPDNSAFGPARRIGRKMVGVAERQRYMDLDVERFAHEKALAPAIAAIREANPGVSDEAIREYLGRETYLRSVGLNRDSIDEVIAGFDPNEQLTKFTWDDVRDLPSSLARDNYGIEFARVNDHDNYDLPGPDETLGEFYQRQQQLINYRDAEGNAASPYELRVLSRRHQTARMQRDGIKEQMDDSIKQALDSGFITPYLHNLQDLGEQKVALTAENWAEHKDKVLGDAEGSWEVFFEVDPARQAQTSIPGYNLGSGMNIDPDEVTKALHEKVRNTVSKYKEMKARAKSFDEHSRFLANQYNIRDGAPLEALSQFPPRVVKILKEIRDNKLDGVDHADVENYFANLGRLREKSADSAREWMGEDLFTEEAYKRNVDRGYEWVNDDTPRPDDERHFFPMMEESSASPGRYWDNREKDSIQEAPVDKNPGDPFDLFLSGKFRTDYKVILDDFERNRNYAAGKQLFQMARSMAMRIDKDQYARHKGKEISEADAMNENYRRGTFVRLKRYGILSKESEHLSEAMNRMALMQQYMGAPAEAVGEFRKVAVMAKHADLTDPEGVPLSGVEHDPIVRKNRNEGAPDEDEILIIPTEIYRGLRSELLKGQQSLKGAMRVITDVWKHTVLHMRFLGWMKNNIFGAHLMVAMAGGPKAYLETLGRRLSDPEGSKEMTGIIKENMQDTLASGSSLQARETNLAAPDTLYGQYQRRFVLPLTEFNSKFADDPSRIMRIMQLMDDQLKVTEQMTGVKTGDLTPEQVQKYMDDPVMRQELARRTNTDMVDFADMSEFEKKWLRSIFPFWAWMKGSTKASARLAADHPGRVWGMGEVASVGEAESVSDNGNNMADFARGWWDPGKPGGMILDTAGMNPYANATDWVQMGLGLVPDVIPGDRSSSASFRQYGAENMLSGMHPFLGGGIEALTGRNVFFGTPIPNEGIGSTFLRNQLDVPPINFLKNLVQNETGPDATVRKSQQNTLLNYMGIPMKDPRWAQVNQRGWDEISERYRSGLARRELRPLSQREGISQ